MRERSQRPDRAYAAIPNAAMRDESISMEARGLLALLMTYSDDWTFQKSHLMQVTGWGRDKFEKHIGELRAAQYIKLVQDRDQNGRLLGSTWIICDEGHRGPEIQVVGDATEALKNRGPVKPSPGKSAPLRRTTDQEEQKQETQTLFAEMAEAKKPDPFPEFWEAYPACKRKTDRAKALALFNQITAGKHRIIPKADPAEIIRGLKAYAATNPDQEYIPLPTTWLNGERWLAFKAKPEGKVIRVGDVDWAARADQIKGRHSLDG
jgi:hypothetical protein